MAWQEDFSVSLPMNISVLGIRFICSIMMHLEVEDDIRSGLRMMKYLINHNNDFANPFYAFVVAFLQAFTGLAAEVFCIIFLCSLQDIITIIWRYVAYGFISRIDNIYAESLDTDHKLHGQTDPLVVKR